MRSGQVIGTVTSTTKHASLEGWKLLVVQPYRTDGCTPDGDPQLAIDPLGAGCGNRVLLSSDGQCSKKLTASDRTPLRWAIIGIQDQ